jgi:nitrite reductase (NO-forming)
MSFKYVPGIGQVNKLELNKNAELFKVKPGELTRWYIVNAGPNDGVSFHFIGTVLSVHDGTNKANDALGTQLWNDETYWITPASGSVIEATFPSAGLYVGVDHAMKDVLRGGAFAVVGDGNSTNTDHPTGTWVPPAGSKKVTDDRVVKTEAELMASNMTSTGGNMTGGNATMTGGNATMTGGNATMTGGNTTNSTG